MLEKKRRDVREKRFARPWKKFLASLSSFAFSTSLTDSLKFVLHLPTLKTISVL